MKKKAVFSIVLLFCLIIPSLTSYADYTYGYNYIYDFWGNANRSIAAFELSHVIDSSIMPHPLSSIDDLCVHGERVYIVDAVESRLNVIDKDGNFITSIKLIRDKDNKIAVNEKNEQLILSKPEGVYANDTDIYIADTGAERVIQLDAEGFYLKRVITRPANMVGDTSFKPSKIAVDNAGRIFIVVQGSYEGIIELNEDGTFSRYFGVNKPRVNPIDYFWKSLASDVQKQKMRKVYAPPFNNLEIDSEGFVYATTADSAAQEKVFRLNSKGENVILQQGYTEIIGDVIRDNEEGVTSSQFVDIAVSDYGVYALIDRVRGRVFIYNFDGNLMNVFGALGDMKGNFKDPSAIEWQGNNLIVADRKLACAFVFVPTEFGKTALGAAENYYRGNWDEANELLTKALEMNANYDLAYVGIGKNLLMQDKYEEAMYYFKLGNDRTYYSKAYNGYRNIVLQRNFWWIAILIALLIVAVIYSEFRYHKKLRELEGE